MKGLLAKKQAKKQKGLPDSSHKLDWVVGKSGLDADKAARRSKTEDKQVKSPHQIFLNRHHIFLELEYYFAGCLMPLFLLMCVIQYCS